MAVLSGRKIRVKKDSTVVTAVAEFSLIHFSDAQGVVDSSTDGGTMRPCGNKDWTGSWRAAGHTPLVFPNDIFTFSGALNDDGRRAYGTARCKKIEIIGMVGQQGAYWEHIVDFGGNDASGLQYDSTDVGDAAAGTYSCVATDYIDLDGVAESNVEWMRLIIESDFEPYKDSSTTGMYLRDEGDIDWALSYGRKCDDWTDFPTVDSTPEVKMYVTPSTYWDLAWGDVIQSPNFKHNRKEKKTPLSGVVVIQMQAVSGTTIGYIKNPAGTTKWPT